MAFPPHALCALSGSWNASDMVGEVWQCGIRLSTHDPSGGYLAGPQAYCDVVAPLIKTWFNTAQFDPRATLTMVKVNNITPAGHYRDPVTHQTPIVGGVGTGGATSVPVFNTLAATLETGNTTGHARRGRIYLPVTMTVDAGKGVSVNAATRDAVRDKVKALLTILLRNEPTGGLLVNPIIATRIDGNYNDITGVSVNDVIDVQRRRKNRVRGTRSAITAFP